LTQKFDKKERVISYSSEKLSQPQQKWSTYDREFFVLLCGVRANAHYSPHAAFLAITDHRPLLAWRKVDAQKDPTGPQTHWAIELDTYEFELIHKKGKIHTDADTLSRRSDDDDNDYASDDEEVLAGFTCEDDEDQFILLGIGELDDYSAVKFSVRSSYREILKQHQEGDIIVLEVMSCIRRRVRPPPHFKETICRIVLQHNAHFKDRHVALLCFLWPRATIALILRFGSGGNQRQMCSEPCAEAKGESEGDSRRSTKTHGEKTRGGRRKIQQKGKTCPI
jgi:hypothetical protein